MSKTKLQQKVRKLERDHRTHMIKLEEELSHLKHLIHKKDNKIKSLTEENHYLTSQFLEDELNEIKIETKSDKMYTIPLRKCVYRALIHNVPVQNVSVLLDYFAQVLPGAQLKQAPHTSTVARMMYEPGVLALIQASEVILKCDVATIAFDATTVVDQHLNEFHVSTFPPQRCYAVSTARLPGGKALDYSAHIVRSIKEMARCYSEYKNIPEVEVLEKFLVKFRSCLSDRAPVNSSVKQMLEEELNIQLIQLHCNVHPLDTFASECLSTLLAFDKEEKIKPFKGTDGIAVTIIKNVSKLRYSYKGEPAAFKSFLKKNGVAPGVFLRYVGNRLHILYHMAGVVFKHKELLLSFLASNEKNDTCKALYHDLGREHCLIQLQALGLLGKLITGPWMKIVYKNASGMSNLEMGCIFQTATQQLTLFKSDPELMLSAREDVFGQPLNIIDDNIHQSLLVVAKKEVLLKMLSMMLCAIENVLVRQMEIYLTGEYTHPSSEMIETTKSAAPHNIQSERNLGLIDFLIRRAPNATIGYLDSKVKAKINNTLEWLDEQPLAIQEQLIRFSVKRGALILKAFKNMELEIDDEILARIIKSSKMREKSDRKKTRKKRL